MCSIFCLLSIHSFSSFLLGRKHCITFDHFRRAISAHVHVSQNDFAIDVLIKLQYWFCWYHISSSRCQTNCKSLKTITQYNKYHIWHHMIVLVNLAIKFPIFYWQASYSILKKQKKKTSFNPPLEFYCRGGSNITNAKLCQYFAVGCVGNCDLECNRRFKSEGYKQINRSQ